MRYLIAVLSIFGIAGHYVRQSQRIDERHQFAYVAFQEGLWRLEFSGDGKKEDVSLKSDIKLLASTRNNLVFGVNRYGLLITVGVSSKEVSSKEITISGKPVGPFYSYDVAWGESRNSIIVF